MNPVRYQWVLGRSVIVRLNSGPVNAKFGQGINRARNMFFGIVLLAIAAFFGLLTGGFHAEKDLSRYREIQLSYRSCSFEQVFRSKGSSSRRLVFYTPGGRYYLVEGVWLGHLSGPQLANALAGRHTVRAWLHPSFPRALRGLRGRSVEVPPEWGLAYDQRNMRIGFWLTMALVGLGTYLVTSGIRFGRKKLPPSESLSEPSHGKLA